MNGDYTILEKSMNGVKTLSDGISIISNGIATHENIYYTEFIKSEDEKTVLLNDTITTETINVDTLNALDIVSNEVDTGVLSCDYLYVNNINNPLQDVLEVDGNLNKMKVYGQTEFRDVLSIIDKNMTQTQGGTIQQTGTNFNTLKDTKINGFLEVGSNITQTGGSTVLKDITCDNITMNSNKGISQSGSGVSNTLGTSTITNLTITGTVTFPSTIETPAVTTSDDIVMNGSSVIIQDTTVSTTKFNKFRFAKMLDIDVDGNINQTKAGATATLKNTTIQGTSFLQGDIEQTSGFTKLNTIECNNITLRLDNDVNLSGTGKISQIGTGVNSMNAINLNNNQNITFNGSGIISQALSGTNILSNYRTAGFGIVGGRNNTTFGHYQNIQNNNGLQFQYNRDNSTFYSYLTNNRSGAGGGFRFQRYNGGVYVDEPMVIDDNITMNKNLNIAGGSLTCSSATIGIISQNELNCLDNCNINILTKFNTIDNEIASLQTTTGGVSAATTGITYSSGTDTTTIDNNLIISSGKSFILGLTNLNSFIANTDTFISAASNTLQGIVYTSVNDTTTINNNVSITGNLLVQGMNIKAEIDALETSFTTGTLNTTTLTAGTLNVSNQINMTNPTRAFRNINNIGYLNFCDTTAGSDINSLSIGQSGVNTFFNSIPTNGIFTFLGGVTDNRFNIMPNSSNGNFNPTTKTDDILLFGNGGSVSNQSLNLTVWSTTPTGVRVEPTKTTITGGSNNIITDASNGIIMSIQNEPLIELNNTQMKVNTSFHIDNTAEFIPNYLTETSFTKTLGTSNIYAGLMSVSEFKRQINVNIPISVYRQYRNVTQSASFANIIQDTLNSVGYTIYKNGLFFGSGTCPTTDTMPKSVHMSSTSSTTSRNYEVYMTNISFSFIPPFEKTTNVFTFFITPNYTIQVLLQEQNLIVENFGYFTNTNVSTSTFPLTAGTTPGLNYSSSSYSFSDYGSKYLTGLGSAKLNSVVSNTIDNQFQINTATLVANSTTSTNISSTNISATSLNSSTIQTNNLYCPIDSTIRMFNGLAGYAIDGPPFLATPIFCSLRSFGRANTDNVYYLNSGYKVELFNGVDYVSFIALLDNTNNPTGNSFTLSDSQRDRTESIKVYFMNEEIRYFNLSYTV